MKTIAVCVLLGLFVLLAQGAPSGTSSSEDGDSNPTPETVNHNSEEQGGGSEEHRHHHGGHHPHHHGGHHPHHNGTMPPHHHGNHTRNPHLDGVTEAQGHGKEHMEEKKLVKMVVPVAVGIILLLAAIGVGFLIYRKCRKARPSKIPFEKFDEKPPVLVQNMLYDVKPPKE